MTVLRDGYGETWQPQAAMPARCNPGHTPRGPGTLDESARRLSHTELAVAELLRDEGHRVRSLPERPGRGRVADLEVCGQPIEVKSWLPQAERQGPPRARSVYNKLASARSQASTVVLYGAGSGLSAAAARAGVAEFSARGQWGRLRDVRVVGEGFDLSWSRSSGVERGRGAGVGAAGDGRGARQAVRPPSLGW